MLVSTIAFGVWAFAIGGPFAALQWYKPVYGGILLPAYTFLIPIFAPGGGPAASTDAGVGA